MSIATEIASILGDDGRRFEADGGSLESLCQARGARVQYGRSLQDDDGTYHAEQVTRSEYCAGDPIRYLFGDGSAIVVAGEAWDLEGGLPFSWAGSRHVKS